MQYNSDIHHRHSIRLQDFDYSQNGYYFITICTKNRECFLGEITNEKIKLSTIGEIVYKYWIEIPQHFGNTLSDEFVIMPNHVHGIVVIENNNVMHDVRACHGMPQRFGTSISKSLPMIVNHFKSAVKRWCNNNGFEYFQWQRNYYEHIIRNESELNRIREYIKNNPIQWEFDRNNLRNTDKINNHNT